MKSAVVSRVLIDTATSDEVIDGSDVVVCDSRHCPTTELHGDRLCITTTLIYSTMEAEGSAEYVAASDYGWASELPDTNEPV